MKRSWKTQRAATQRRYLKPSWIGAIAYLLPYIVTNLPKFPYSVPKFKERGVEVGRSSAMLFQVASPISSLPPQIPHIFKTFLRHDIALSLPCLNYYFYIGPTSVRVNKSHA